MNSLIKIILVVVCLLILSGCEYRNVEYDPNYLEIYVSQNSGWYINTEQPRLIIDDYYIIPLIEDYRIIGNWLIAGQDGDAILTFTDDNYIFIEEQLFGEWYWITPNTLLAILYGDGSMSTLRFDYIDGANDFAQFTEYNTSGTNSTFLGIHE